MKSVHWTKAMRAEASKKAKERLALKKRSATLTLPKGASHVIFETLGAGGGGGSNSARAAMTAKRSTVEVPATDYAGETERELYKAAHLLWDHGMITDRQLLDVTAKVFA